MGWISTSYPGVRYREHATRRHLGTPDKYFALRYTVNGKSREEGLGWAMDGWTAKKAAAVLADLRRAHATGEGPQTLSERRRMRLEQEQEAERQAKREQTAELTFAKFFEDYYLPVAKRDKSSWLGDQQRFDRTIGPIFGRLPLRAITQESIKKFLDGLKDAGMAQSTVNQHHAIIRHAYNIAVSTIVDGVRLFEGQSPVNGISAPDPLNERDRFLSYEQADSLIDAAAKRDQDLHDFIVISLNTGLRLGEIKRMTWLDVDLQHSILTVRDAPQRKPGGKVPINPEAADVLEKRKTAAGEGARLVFPGQKGTERDISRAFKKLVDSLGFNDGVEDRLLRVVFHTLRHTFASWLAIAGTDIYRIKKLMRHKTLKMTERYAHLIPDATKAAVHNLRPPRAS